MQKYGVIEDSNKKAERSYSPGNVPRVYSCFNPDTEKVVKKNNTNSEFTSVFVIFPCGGQVVIAFELFDLIILVFYDIISLLEI